jgi:hypothetical protein
MMRDTIAPRKNKHMEKAFAIIHYFWQELLLEAKYQATTTGWSSMSRSKELYIDFSILNIYIYIYMWEENRS